jgi:hypothetical protein
MKRLAVGVILALALVLPSLASGAVVYEEVTNLDDLPIDAPYPVVALGPGTNSVLGGTSFSADAVDSFSFSVPNGSELVSIRYVYTSGAFIRGDGSITLAVSGFSLVAGDGTLPQPGSLLGAENVDMLPGLCSVFAGPCGPDSPSAVVVPLFATELPLAAGLYSLEQRALTVNDPAFVTWNSRYRVDLELVPEPSQALLGLTGGLLLALARKRHAKAR